MGARQRSGEGFVRRNGCPNGCFWRVRFSSAPLRFSGVVKGNLKAGHISEGHPHTEGTFTGTLVNVGDLHRNSGECHGRASECGVVGSPNFAKLRQALPELA